MTCGPAAYLLEPFTEDLVDLVGTEGDHDGQPLPVQRRAQVGEHLQGRDVRAVQVVEHEHGRLQLRGPVEQRRDGRDQPGLVGGTLLADAELGQQQAELARIVAEHPGYVGSRQPGQQRTQRRDQRCVRDAPTEEAHPCATADHGAGRQLGHHLVQQAGLAGTGLTGDERNAWLVPGRRRDESENAGELAVAPDEGLSSRHPDTVAVQDDSRQRVV